MATRAKTPNRGAADIISQVIRKVDRMQVGGFLNAIAFRKWLTEWDVRAAKKPGGLGRK